MISEDRTRMYDYYTILVIQTGMQNAWKACRVKKAVRKEESDKL
jgi:hypothetical protein